MFLSAYFSCFGMEQLQLFDAAGTLSKKNMMALANAYKEKQSYFWNRWDDVPTIYQKNIVGRYYAYKYVLYKKLCIDQQLPENSIISVLQFMKHPHTATNTIYNCRTFPFAPVENVKNYMPQICLVQDICSYFDADIQKVITSFFADSYLLPIQWKIRSYRPITIWKAHEGRINSVSLIDTNRCATVADDGYMKIWNLETQELLGSCNHNNPIQLLDHMLNILVTVTHNNTLWFWNKDTYQLLLTKEYDKPIIDICSLPFTTYIILKPNFLDGFQVTQNNEIIGSEEIKAISNQINVSSITAFNSGFTVMYADSVICFMFPDAPLLELTLSHKNSIIKMYSVGCFLITLDIKNILRIYVLNENKLKHIKAFRINEPQHIPHCIGIDSHLVVNTRNALHFLGDHKDFLIKTKTPVTALAEIDNKTFISAHKDGVLQKWIPTCTQNDLKLAELFLISKRVK